MFFFVFPLCLLKFSRSGLLLCLQAFGDFVIPVCPFGNFVVLVCVITINAFLSLQERCFGLIVVAGEMFWTDWYFSFLRQSAKQARKRPASAPTTPGVYVWTCLYLTMFVWLLKQDSAKCPFCSCCLYSRYMIVHLVLAFAMWNRKGDGRQSFVFLCSWKTEERKETGARGRWWR